MPNEVYDVTGATWEIPYGSLAQWMFDSAVTWFGITIENALSERVKVTMGKEVTFKPKYTLARLLNERFRLPKPQPEPEDNPNPWASLLAWAGKRNSGVKRYKYVN
jgi:hypothetical protein